MFKEKKRDLVNRIHLAIDIISEEKSLVDGEGVDYVLLSGGSPSTAHSAARCHASAIAYAYARAQGALVELFGNVLVAHNLAVEEEEKKHEDGLGK